MTRRRRDSTTYEIGYGKPPAEHRFKPGMSGNPKGRPKGTRNVATDLEAELSTLIVVREGNREMRIPRQQAIVKRLVAKALGGDIRAAQLVLSLPKNVLDRSGAAEADDAPFSADEQTVLDILRQRLLPQPPGPGGEPKAGGDPDQPATKTEKKA